MVVMPVETNIGAFGNDGVQNGRAHTLACLIISTRTKSHYAQHKISLTLAGANKLTVLTNKTGAVYSAI